MTWADQKRQFGRVIRSGRSSQEAKLLGPLCQKCTTLVLRGETSFGQ
jgi:hypothetical protein